MDTELQTAGYKKVNDWTWEKNTGKAKIRVEESNQFYINAVALNNVQLVGVWPVSKASLMDFLKVVESECQKETS